MLLDRFKVTDKVAIITGSGRGIGAASALALAEAGADVVITARTQADLDTVVGQVEALGRRAVAVPADLSDLSNLDLLVDAAVNEFGRLDIVINNVGGTMPMPFIYTTEQFLEEAFHFNVTTAFGLSRRALPHLVEHGDGAIVNISSAMGRLTERGYLAYGTAKAALAHMTRLMASDLAPRVRVNALAVGSVATSALDIVMQSDELKTTMEQATPLRRLGEPEEVALAVLYLASPAAAWITGKVYEIDGGTEYPNLTLPLPDLDPSNVQPES